MSERALVEHAAWMWMRRDQGNEPESAAWVLTWLPGQKVKQGQRGRKMELEVPGRGCSSCGGDWEWLETKAQERG